MKIIELLETVTVGMVTANEIAGGRSRIFDKTLTRIPLSKNKKQKMTDTIPKITFKQHLTKT